MNIKSTYFLSAVILASGCEKIPDTFVEKENSVNINTSWNMITSEPAPDKCVVVFRDSSDNFVKSHEIDSPADKDTLRDGSYAAYSYYAKEGAFTVKNIEDYKETQFVIEAISGGIIPANSELYISNPSELDIYFFKPGNYINQCMSAAFTAVTTEVIFVGGSNTTGVNSCDISIDNVFNTYQIHSRSTVTDALSTAKTSLAHKDNNFRGQGYYLGFDPEKGNTLTLDLKTDGLTGTAQTDLNVKLSTFTQKVKIKLYVYCDVTRIISGGKFFVEIRSITIDDAESITVDPLTR